ncbi:MAG: sulfatase [Phycisphaerales bacterium]|nr:MAG: sulfatase [Phycisphaerales bacterium]
MRDEQPNGRRSRLGPRRSHEPLLLTVCWLLCGLAGGCNPAPQQQGNGAAATQAARRNVLLISLCSVRADHLGCYGYPRATSPQIDAFAKTSVLFEHAVAQWPKTVPSFVSLLTGLYPHTTEVMRITPWQRLDDSFLTLAETFRAVGYQTAAYVSSPALNKSVNLNQGFDTYVETYRRPAAFEQTCGGALGWLQIRNEAPFFLWVHFNNAHVPYLPPPDLAGIFVDDPFYDSSRKVKINSEHDGLAVSPDHPYATQIRRPVMGGVHPLFALPGRPTELDYYVAEYDAAIRSADRLIGDLLKGLEDLHLTDDTVVVLLSDHGESLGEHNYYFEHGRLPYESAQRVPLIIRSPGSLPAGQSVACPVALIDVAPTILDSAGLEIPPATEGQSLLPVVHSEESSRDVFFCAGYQLDFMTGIRWGGWKLVRVPNEMDRAIMTGAEYELYDLQADPAESRNLYEARLDVAAPLRQRLLAWTEPWYERAAQTIHKAGPTAVDEETRRRLKALGYISDNGEIGPVGSPSGGEATE